MGKNKFMGRQGGPRGPVGIPPGMEIGVPQIPAMPGQPMPTGLPPELANLPPGSSVVEMSEADGLRFHNLKLESQVLEEQVKKLEADEQVLRVSKDNLDLRKQMVLLRTKEFYKAVGIEGTDQISMRNSKYYRIRPPAPPAPLKPGEVRPKPPDLKIFRDEQGRETIVPKEGNPEVPPELSASEPPPAPAKT